MLKNLGSESVWVVHGSDGLDEITLTGPSFVAYSNYLVPIFAVLLGAAVLNETLGWNILVALALVLSGIAISRIQPRKQAAPA